MIKRIWNFWKELSRKIGNFQARILLTIIYVVVVMPFGLAARFFSDPLHIKKRPQRWLDHPGDRFGIDWARKQW